MLSGIVGFISLYQIDKIAKPINKEIPESVINLKEDSNLDALARFIQYYDEVLTMSARNYAFTSDQKWEERYKDVEPKLDAIIKEAINKGDKKDKEFFSVVDASNLALVAMEYDSINYTNNGNPEEAVKILESEEYWEQKNIYLHGLVNYVERRGVEYDEAIDISSQTIDSTTEKTQVLVKRSRNLIVGFIIISLLLGISLGFFISRSISRPLQKLVSVVDEISKGNLKVNMPKDAGDIDEIKDLMESQSRIIKTMKLAILETKEKKPKKRRSRRELEKLGEKMSKNMKK